jgi:pimeloyl-ACP methyl ester carboxylesterase
MWIFVLFPTLLFRVWLSLELVFVVIFYRVWLPRFQKLRPPEDYRDYARDRRKLLIRILQRLETNCRLNNTPILPTIQAYVREWFHPVVINPCDEKTRTAYASAFKSKEEFWPKKGDMDQFFSWAFFGKHFDELEPWMLKDMERMYETIESHYGLTFEDGVTPGFKPMRLSLDPLEPAYRPFIIYGLFSLIKIMAGLLLRSAGFYACNSSSGLKYFYRPHRKSRNNTGKSDNAAKLTPLIFLHGIAPGGLAFYLPMLFFFGGDGRPLLFFENPDISFFILGGNPPNEHDTVHGVWEAVDRHLGESQEVSVVGHSFGSCAVTWLVHSVQKTRINQIVLVDPVSILLSEPDVVQNFLYQRKALKRRKMPIKIGVVSNEIFTEHYLRRHFAWYNSELWLEDLPRKTKVLVCLSAEDPIVPTQKVQREIMRKPEVDVLLWENAGHAHCVTRPKTWHQIHTVMKRQEQMILQESLSTPDGKKDE